MFGDANRLKRSASVARLPLWLGVLLFCLAPLSIANAQTTGSDDVPGRILDFLFEQGPGIVEDLSSDRQQRQTPDSMAQVQLSFAPVVRLASPAVVNVFATRREQIRDPFANMDPFFRRFFGDQMPQRPRERMASSLGSGVIVDPSGIIITNNHVIDGADDVRIALADRREFAAQIVIRDERTDLAVLQIDDLDGELPSVTIGASDDLQVGDVVLAIGNPFGVGQTVTQGIVSALARTQVGVTDFQFFIQTDAAINPGNSGGALVDLSGNLVGINTAIFSRSGGSNGIGFAIPTEMVRVVLDQASSGADFVTRPYLGAEVQTVTSAIAQGLGMRLPRGVLIADIVPGGPAARSGLRRGDVVIAVDDNPVNDPEAFEFRFSLGGIGNTTRLSFLRNGREGETSMQLERPPETVPRDVRMIRGRSPFAGIEVINLSPAVAQELGLDDTEGVMVNNVQRGSPADQIGWRPRDLILQVNGVRVDRTENLESLAAARVVRWDIVYQRDGRIRYANIRF